MLDVILTAWDVIRQIRESEDMDLKGGFFEDLPEDKIVQRPAGIRKLILENLMCHH